MKKLFSEAVQLRNDLWGKEKEISEQIEKDYGCSISFTHSMVIVKNEYYSFHIWFMKEVVDVEKNGCAKMPDDDKDFEVLLEEIKAKKIEINTVRQYLIDLLDLKERVL